MTQLRHVVISPIQQNRPDRAVGMLCLAERMIQRRNNGANEDNLVEEADAETGEIQPRTE